MATNIGPKIGIDGEAEYRKKINNIIQQANTLASEMKAVTAGFDSSTTAQEKAAAKSEVLAKQIKVQEERVAELSKMLQVASDKYGENDTKVLSWQQALNNAKADLLKMERELRDATEELEDMGEAADDAANPIKDVGDAMDGAGVGALSFGEALKAGGIIEGAKAVIGVVTELIEATEEYRTIMASLEVSSARNGYTAQETAEGYRLLYGVLGDEQSSATALANLQALQVDQATLTKIINGSIGAWAAYGDSIPIDGLAESINETVKAGKVTGTFADVLNWAGTNEDEFNAKLEACADTSERMELVLQELSGQGLVDLGKAWQRNNKDLVDANNAANDTTQAYARFAKMAAPAVNMVQQETANLLNGLMDLMEGTSTFDMTVNQAMESAATGFASACDWMSTQADILVEGLQNTAEDIKWIFTALPDKAFGWGGDFINQYSKGILSEVPDLELTVQEVADLVNSYLHFSVPDVGPLSDADEYGPDFMKLLAKGIRDNVPLVGDAAALAADAMVIHPQTTTVTKSAVSNVYSFEGMSFNVYAAEGQSPQEIAWEVMDIIQNEVVRKEAVFGA